MMKTKGDGIWVSEKIKVDKSIKDIPIIMITAVNQDPDMVKYHFEKDVGKEMSFADKFEKWLKKTYPNQYASLKEQFLLYIKNEKEKGGGQK